MKQNAPIIHFPFRHLVLPSYRSYPSYLYNVIISFLIALFISTSYPTTGEAYPSNTDSLTIYVFLLDECVISQFYTPLLNDFHKEYKDKRVGFAGYFPGPSTKPDHVQDFGTKYHLKFPLQEDYHQALAKKLGIKVTPEVAVWDHRSGQLIYRGRIDDSYVRVGKRKLHPQNHDLKDVIDNWLKGNIPDKMIETQAIGCFINFGKS